MDKDEKYIDIADKLKNLEKVEASHNFTHNLQAKIIELESEKRKEHAKRNEETKGGFLRDFFGNLQYPWIVPAAGFTILVFFVFYITYQNKNALEISNDDKSINQTQIIEEGKPTEEQTPPSVTKNKETESDLNPQTTENKIDKNNIGNSLPDKKLARDNSEGLTYSDNGSDKKSEKSAKIIEKDPVTETTTDKKLSADTDDNEVFAKTEDKGGENEENEVTEFKGKASNEKSRTMANVKPESKDTSSSKKDKKSKVSSMMMKINKIDKEALEKIHEEISK